MPLYFCPLMSLISPCSSLDFCNQSGPRRSQPWAISSGSVLLLPFSAVAAWLQCLLSVFKLCLLGFFCFSALYSGCLASVCWSWWPRKYFESFKSKLFYLPGDGWEMITGEDMSFFRSLIHFLLDRFHLSQSDLKETERGGYQLL